MLATGPEKAQIVAQAIEGPVSVAVTATALQLHPNTTIVLDQAAASLKQVLNPHFAHHERTLSALASTHRELDEALDAIISTLKTYYWIVADAYLDFEVSYPEDPLAIFQFPWIKPELV